MASGVGASKLATNQTLTANYAVTNTIGAFSISEEKLATLDFKYTTGAAEAGSALKFKLEYSPNESDWVQESYSSLSAGVNTLSPVEYSLAGGAGGTTYTGQLLVPLCSSNVRVSVKETGVGANYGSVTVWLSVVSNGGQQRNLASASGGGGDATAANQVTGNASLTSIDGKITACNTGAVAGTVAVSNSEFPLPAAQVATLTPPAAITGFATSAKQLADGHNVTVATPTSQKGPADPTVDSYTSVAISAAANTANQVILAAPGAGKQIWGYHITGSADTGDGSIAFQDEDDTAITGVMAVANKGGFVMGPSGNFSMPLFKVATNKALEIDTVTCGFKGIITYGVIIV